MEFLAVLLSTGISIVILILIFTPLERAFPAKKEQPIFRKAWILDAAYFFGQYLFFHSLMTLLIGSFSHWIFDSVPTGFRFQIWNQPLWLQTVEVVFFSDLFIYWAHRLQHQWSFLWRFHKVHHSAERLDWLAAHREHPLDTIYTVTIINLPAILLGFNLDLIAGLIAFRGIWAVYIHSNVRLPIGPLKMLIGAPELHHWHHYLDKDAGNYANISPIMDLLFGTYTCPDHEPEEVGISEVFPTTYIGQMIHPLLPKK